MIYTVSEAAKILNVAPSTIRYYDKEGLLPFVERSKGGIRIFSERDFNWLLIIDCLKKSGLSIKDIKRYIDMSLQGDETVKDRLEIFQTQKEKVISQIKELQNTLNVLEYKCWFYQTALKAGTTSVPQNMSDEEIPKHLQNVRKSLSIPSQIPQKDKR